MDTNYRKRLNDEMLKLTKDAEPTPRGSSGSGQKKNKTTASNRATTTVSKRWNQNFQNPHQDTWFPNSGFSAQQTMWNQHSGMATGWHAQQGLNSGSNTMWGNSGNASGYMSGPNMNMGYGQQSNMMPNAYSSGSMMFNTSAETFHNYQTLGAQSGMNEEGYPSQNPNTSAHFAGMRPTPNVETATQNLSVGKPTKRKKSRKKWKEEKRKAFLKRRKMEKKERLKEMRADAKRSKVLNQKQRKVQEDAKKEGESTCSTNDSSVDRNDANNNMVDPRNDWKKRLWYLFPGNACWVCRMRIKGIRKNWRVHEAEKHVEQIGKQVTSERMMEWVYLVNGLLWTMCRIFELKDLDDLVQYARKFHLHGKKLEPFQIRLMSFFEKANGLSSDEIYHTNPVNCVAALLCSIVIQGFVKMMTDEEVNRLYEERMMDYNGKEITDPKSDVGLPGLVSAYPMAADAHVHLDRLFLRTGKKNYAGAVTRLPEPRSIIMDLVVASCSLPDTWPDEDAIQHQTGQDLRVKMSIGWNPMWGTIPGNDLLRKFYQLLSVKNVVAAGEIGLSYNADTTENDRLVQRTLMQKVVPPVALSRLPLILLCKEATEGYCARFSAVSDCINIMKNTIPGDYPVYVSGFNSNAKVYRRWIKNFPQVVFGISQVILDEGKVQKGVEEVIEIMDEKRLLLETNVPVYTPHAYLKEGLVAHQDLLADIAEKVASIRLTHRTFVMQGALKAARDFFRV